MKKCFRWSGIAVTILAALAVMGCNNPADKLKRMEGHTLKPVGDSDLILKSLTIFDKDAMSGTIEVEAKAKIAASDVKAVFAYGSVDAQELAVIVHNGELKVIGENKVWLFVPDVNGKYKAWSKQITVKRFGDYGLTLKSLTIFDIPIENNELTVENAFTKIEAGDVKAVFDYGKEKDKMLPVKIEPSILMQGDNTITLSVPALDGTYKAWSKQITVVRHFIIYKTDGSGCITGYICAQEQFPKHLNIPEKIGDEIITSIGASAFIKCTTMESLTLPNAVTSIGEKAFQSCDKLITVNLPDVVTTIGANAFSYCYQLTNINFPNSLETIGNSAFIACKGLTKLKLPDSVTDIGENAFSACSNLTDITLPNKLTTIRQGTFSNLYELTNIELPNTLTSIGYAGFENCKKLTKITLPESLESIGWYAFKLCEKLTKITLPESLKSIAWYAFDKCEMLETIIIKSTVLTKVGKNAFREISPNAKFTVKTEAVKTLILESSKKDDGTYTIEAEQITVAPNL